MIIPSLKLKSSHTNPPDATNTPCSPSPFPSLSSPLTAFKWYHQVTLRCYPSYGADSSDCTRQSIWNKPHQLSCFLSPLPSFLPSLCFSHSVLRAFYCPIHPFIQSQNSQNKQTNTHTRKPLFLQSAHFEHPRTIIHFSLYEPFFVRWFECNNTSTNHFTPIYPFPFPLFNTHAHTHSNTHETTPRTHLIAAHLNTTSKTMTHKGPFRLALVS